MFLKQCENRFNRVENISETEECYESEMSLVLKLK
jgi:hypothetical protein